MRTITRQNLESSIIFTLKWSVILGTSWAWASLLLFVALVHNQIAIGQAGIEACRQVLGR